MRILDTFNFGSSIKRWINTFYTNIESAILNNGYTTNWFKPSKGVRQGCPLSPFLFILSAELMSIKIRHDPGLFGNEQRRINQDPREVSGSNFTRATSSI